MKLNRCFLLIHAVLALLMVTPALASEDEKAERLFEQVFQSQVDRSPMFQADLGIKTNNDKWDDLSDRFAKQGHKLNKKHLARLKKISAKKLSESTLLSYRLLKTSLQRKIKSYRWRYHNYPINQMFGWHTTVPSVLINQHSIDSVADAKAYITRINSVPKLMGQLIDGLVTRQKKGVIAPKFVFPLVIDDSNNLLSGLPFNGDANSVLYDDFSKKLAKLEAPEKTKKALDKELQAALKNSFKPAYEGLISYLKVLEKKADNRAGAWKLPRGKRFYNAALENTTTTDLTAQEIHSLGLSEVARIHQEMLAIKDKVAFTGDLQQFFAHMRDSEKFYYKNNESGRAEYLKNASQIIDNMKQHLDKIFKVKPKADLITKRVEPFREQSAGKAFYYSPAVDGSRPGIYYANLFNMSEMPIYEMEALAYHEGIPGHHMQISIAQELEGVPEFRKHEFYTAYVEGWGLYSELLPKEYGFYSDPYSDFGRLSMELWRACRLVVDTGLHAKKWTKAQAVEYLVKNTPSPKRNAVRAIERYIVMPSQATAYKVGMLKILELREKAKAALKSRFDIREFHDVVLKDGAIPLNVLEEQVDAWVQTKAAS